MAVVSQKLDGAKCHPTQVLEVCMAVYVPDCSQDPCSILDWYVPCIACTRYPATCDEHHVACAPALHQVLALFSKAVRKLYAHLRAAKEAAVARTLPVARPVSMLPHAVDVDEELDEAAQVRMEGVVVPGSGAAGVMACQFAPYGGCG